MTITAVQPEGAVGQWDNVWTHTYNVTLNPSDGSFTGTGSVSGTIDGFSSTETITGQLDGDTPSASRRRATRTASCTRCPTRRSTTRR